MASLARPTLKSIAERLGISPSTVSRTLNGQGKESRISDATQQAVRQMAEELGFAPNLLARGLRLKKTAALGLIVPDIANPFFARIAHELAVWAREHGYSIALWDSQDQTAVESKSLEALARWRVDGLFVCPVGTASEHFRAWERGPVPMVVIDRLLAGRRLPSVSSDNHGGARAATLHLLDLGHRRIACIQGLPGTSTNEERTAGYREALGERGVKIDKRLIAGDSFSDEAGYQAMRGFLRVAKRPTAVLALGNPQALGAMRAVGEVGLKIPDDISLVGFGDLPYADYLATPLTTVAQDVARLGQEASALMCEAMRRGKLGGAACRRVPTRLVLRSSVRGLN